MSSLTKEEKRNLFKDEKRFSLEKNEKLINEFRIEFEANDLLKCDLENDNIQLIFCETKYEKRLWTAFVHLTSSLPYRGAVGRQVKILALCRNHIIGMIHLTSPLAQLKLRDKFLGWSYEDKWKKKKINKIYNIETCVPTKKYSKYLTGKLLIYLIFTSEVENYLHRKYGDEILGFETTSLFGKSSMYNRIPFLKYLGTTEGLSAVYISDEDWKRAKRLYENLYSWKRGKITNTKRLAPVKFQILDKLREELIRDNKDIPFEVKNINYSRGVYFGFLEERTIKERIGEWRNRWFLKRKKTLEEKEDD